MEPVDQERCLVYYTQDSLLPAWIPKPLKKTFTTAAMPDGNKRAIYRVYYVCAIECPSRWGLNDAVLRAVYNPLVDLDVLDLDGPPAHVKGIFARHDLNGDGHLSRPEVSELITEFCELLHLEMTQAQRDQLLNEHFDAADKNRDSVLTLDEFRDFAALLDTAASALAGTGTAADAAAPDLLQKYAKLRREKKPRGDQEGSLLVDTQCWRAARRCS